MTIKMNFVVFALFVALFTVCCSDAKVTTANSTKPATNQAPQSTIKPYYVAQAAKAHDGKFTASSNKLLKDTERLIRSLKFQGPIRKSADEVLANMGNYRKLFSNPPNDGSLDCIMQLHALNENLDAQTKDSQAKTLQILNQEKYDSVGIEGTSSTPVTKENIKAEVSRMAKSAHRDLSEEELDDIFAQGLKLDTSIKYIVDTGSYGVGFEDSSLMLLSMYVQGEREQLNPVMPDFSDLTDLFDNLREIRSRMAFVKTMKAAKDARLSKTAIVIGGSHGKDFLTMSGELGIQIRFFQTMPAKYLEENPYARLY